MSLPTQRSKIAGKQYLMAVGNYIDVAAMDKSKLFEQEEKLITTPVEDITAMFNK